MIARAAALLLPLLACAPRTTTPALGWTSPLLRDHPAAGRVWDVARGEWTTFAAMDLRLREADFVLLGETHDNADHHLLQAARITSLVEAGRRPVVAFEMIDADQQPLVDGAASPDALEKALNWGQSGWPPFALYRPAFEASFRAGLRVVGADLSDAEARGVAREGEVPEDLRGELGSVALTPALDEEWRREMLDSHCGMLPERALGPMVRAQRARDLRLAKRLAETAGEGGAVLVAGAGHVRKDRAAPAWLARIAPGKRVVAVAMAEVTEDPHPERQAWPYDYVLFTPRAARPDPCAAFHAR